MKKIFLGFIIVALFALRFQAAFALDYSVELQTYTGDPATVFIDITGDNTTSITFDVEVTDPAVADIRGIFFNLNVEIPSDLLVTGDDITEIQFCYDSVENLGQGAVITPLGPYDAGIEIGTQGIGLDEIYSTSFTISSASILSLGDEFAARLTSVNGSGSSKLLSNTAVVPEPGTVFLLGFGLLGLLGFGRRLKK